MSTTVIIEIVTFLAVVLLSVTAIRSLGGVIAVRRRLGDQKPQLKTSGRLVKTQDVNNQFLQWVQASTSIKDIKDRTKLRQELAQAGIEHPAAPIWYVIIRLGGAIILPVVFLLSQSLFEKPLSSSHLVLVTLLLSGAGLILPKAYIDRRARRRVEQMEDEFPDVLDLMVVCVEAGLGLEAAFIRVSDEVRISHPRTSEEFGRMSQEIAAGRTRGDALRAMGERSGAATVKSFAALIIQTDSLGVSIGQTLRTYSVEMREHRMLRAEEKAMRIPVLMTVPLVACILPVIIVALLLPAAIDVAQVMIPAMLHPG